MPDLTTWPTPAEIDSLLSDAGITLRAGASTARKQQVLDAIAAEVGRETRRQWIADAVDASRYYDGSGTTELDVEEMVSLTSVHVLAHSGDPGTQLPDVQLVRVQGETYTRIVIARHSLPAQGGHGWGLHGSLYTGRRAFPWGSQNIRVTGKFGYGATIPADVWEAVAGEAAARLAARALFSPTGRLKSWKEKERGEDYDLGVPGAVAASADDRTPTVAIGWRAAYRDALERYRRPHTRRLRRTAPVMI